MSKLSKKQIQDLMINMYPDNSKQQIQEKVKNDNSTTLKKEPKIKSYMNTYKLHMEEKMDLNHLAIRLGLKKTTIITHLSKAVYEDKLSLDWNVLKIDQNNIIYNTIQQLENANIHVKDPEFKFPLNTILKHLPEEYLKTKPKEDIYNEISIILLKE